MERGHDADFNRHHQRDEDEHEAQLAAGETEIDDGVGRRDGNGDFPDGDAEGHDEAVGHHHPHGDAARRLEALREDGGEVLEELAAEPQRRGADEHVERVGRGDQRYIKGKEHNGDAEPEEGVPDGFSQSFLFYHTAFLDLIGHLAFHVTELEEGQDHDDEHQHHGLGRGAAEVEPDEAVVENLVDEGFRGL